METISVAWRGPRGSGKHTKLHEFLQKRAIFYNIPFTIQTSTWYLNKQVSDDASDANEGTTGKSIPYEKSKIHLGFDVARMSMSDKLFITSILEGCWTGQQDICLAQTDMHTRYLVLYHAQYMTDESVLQIQEALEQYPNFSVLVTSELPLPDRLRDHFMEIPVEGDIDMLLESYTTKQGLPQKDVWLEFFKKTADEWSVNWSGKRITDVRQWCYICLQRNLRWSDVIMYWIETVYSLSWVTVNNRKKILDILWRVESGSGWILITSYRIPILWEHVHLSIAKALYKCRMSNNIVNS